MTDDDWAALQRYLATAKSAGQVVEVTAKLVMLTPAEAAKRLGVSRSTITRRIHSGDIHAITVGRAHQRIPLHEFERFRDTLMAQMVAATSDELTADLYAR